MPPVDWLFALWVIATVVFGVGLSLSRLSFLTAFALAWVAHHAPFVVTALIDWANDEAGQKFNWRIPGWNSEQFYLWFSILLAMAVTSWGAWFARRQLAERRFLPGWRSADLSVSAKPREVTPA
jgi:cell division protein FtsX